MPEVIHKVTQSQMNFPEKFKHCGVMKTFTATLAQQSLVGNATVCVYDQCNN